LAFVIGSVVRLNWLSNGRVFSKTVTTRTDSGVGVWITGYPEGTDPKTWTSEKAARPIVNFRRQTRDLSVEIRDLKECGTARVNMTSRNVERTGKSAGRWDSLGDGDITRVLGYVKRQHMDRAACLCKETVGIW